MQNRDFTSFDDLIRFRRFRLNVIEFLKLYPDVSEPKLRAAIQKSSARLLEIYSARAIQAQPSFVAQPNDREQEPELEKFKAA